MKISKGDTVLVISGRDKGKKGTVLRTLHDRNRLVIGGINMVTKHIKKTAQSEGKKIQLEHSISASNVMVIDPKTGKPTRIGYTVDEKTGKKVRIAKKSGTILERIKMQAKDLEKPAEAKAEAAKKPSFWKKGAKAAEGSVKAEAGPVQTAVSHRSSGRDS